MSRDTLVIAVDRDAPDPAVIAEAARLLLNGELVAFATETVYGLGAVATDPVAVAQIFEAKGRPAFNPLIVHASDAAMALTCVSEWPDAASILAQRFWPGPLTFVLPRSRTVPDIVTAGRATVGIRVPQPAVARALIARTGRPLAAPSANRSTGISPTLASHVLHDLNGKIDLVLDSGPTAVGLESTVLDLTTSPPRILRPGPITAEELEQALGGIRVREPVEPSRTRDSASPGQMAVHYAPKTRAVRVADAEQLARVPWPERGAVVVIGRHTPPSLPASLNRFVLATPEAAARGLYIVLHECDRLGVDLIVVVPPPDRPEWRALRDRLWRATRPWSE